MDMISKIINHAGFKPPRKLRPWLYAMARHECHRRLRTKSPSSSADGAGQPADGSRDTGRAELRRLIRATVEELEPDEREVIELSLRHQLNDSDLAVVLGMPARRAHALASHARGQLEQALGMLLIARTGRTTYAALDELLAGWDGRLTSQMRGLVGRHIEECQARTRGGTPAVASTPANIRGGTPASTRAGSPASPEHSNQASEDGLAPAVTPVSPTEQAKPSPSPALSPAPSPSQ